MPDIPELKLALFGQNGVGKTVFFASYYGTQNSHLFEQVHGYRFAAQNRTQGTTLLGRYNRMRQGQFPDGTDSSTTFKFDLRVSNIVLPGLTISWLDYPGRWWERLPSSKEERDERELALTSLISSHAIILLIDGAQMRDQGAFYLKTTLHKFATVVSGLKSDIAKRGGKVEDFPQTILLAVSKADLLEPHVTAKTVAEQVLAEAEIEVNLVRRHLDRKTIPLPS